MWARKRLDIGWSDLVIGAAAAALPCRQTLLQRRAERAWSSADDAIACLSVRSGFDLLLSALALPPGREVVLSALTIPDMPRIVARHGLIPVPADLDLERMEP